MADASDASNDPSTGPSAYAVDPAIVTPSAASASRKRSVGERRVGEERRIAAPAIVIDHERRQRPGVGGDLPVLPTSGAARRRGRASVDEQPAVHPVTP